jgi:hypothetical protein
MGLQQSKHQLYPMKSVSRARFSFVCSNKGVGLSAPSQLRCRKSTVTDGTRTGVGNQYAQGRGQQLPSWAEHLCKRYRSTVSETATLRDRVIRANALLMDEEAIKFVPEPFTSFMLKTKEVLQLGRKCRGYQVRTPSALPIALHALASRSLKR